MENNIKKIRLTKRGISTVVRFSKDGETWLSAEEIFHFEHNSDFDIIIDTYLPGPIEMDEEDDI